jgi:cytochrome c biogenesis protein CcmG, thiol:disulfide interchange protein DsbE
MGMNRNLLWLPLAVFITLFAVMASNLSGQSKPAHVSHLVGKAVPKFSLAAATSGLPGLGSANFAQGQPRLLNIFASWCIPCAAEAPVLMRMARAGVPIDAIAVRDRADDLARFLRRNGNPYQRIGADPQSQILFALGSSGVPETYVIDGRGIIRHHHVGDIRDEDVPELMAALKAAAR